MKTGFNKVFLGISLFLFALPVFAMPGSVVAAYFFQAGTFAFAATAFAVNMVASAILTKAFFSPGQPGGLSGDSDNPGNRQQIPPATDNKLPVVYGQSWLGGTIVDLSITQNNQEIYYVIAICEVTNNGADTITFGDVYWGGKKCTFASASSADVVSLTDESTGTVDTTVNGKLQIYMYNNGSNSVVRGGSTAISVMNASNLIYKWPSSKLMTNTAFAIIKITYSTEANLTGIQQTKFQVTNSRSAPGDCFLDYLTNTVYGAALPLAQVDTTSLTQLNTYCAQPFIYTPSTGGSATQSRFRFDGVLDTNKTIMDNLQDMASCCDCLLRYNEITAQWGVVVQSPTYSVAMALSDSNMVSAIQISPIDLAGSYNVIECKFPDASNQDSFNSSTFNLAQIAPSLLYPNEPVNKQSVSLPLVNNSVRAQYIAIRMLKESREDLQVQVNINFEGIQLEAGDIVTVTNANYGWVNKEFRISKVTEDFASDGSVTAKLFLSEFNSSLYNDVSITEFQPSPNTGIPDPLIFGTVSPPTIGSQNPSAIVPSFDILVTTPTGGIIQYAEIWYSAFSNPTTSQLIFAGISQVQSNGTPWQNNFVLPAITISNIPAGNWYFFARMINSLGTSRFSTASTVLNWRPTTFQFTERYLSVRYADSITGTGFTTNPRNKTFYGLQNVPVATGSNNAADYTWYAGTFGTNNYLLIANRQNRRMSFAVGNAAFNNLGGAFVPTETSLYDSSVWGALEDGTIYIDLDKRTGQLTQAGTTGINSADGLLSVTNNTNGSMVVKLDKFLNFGSGVYSKTFTAATLTIDIYGRVVGFTQPDDFFFTESVFSATAGQTTFSVTHVVGNIMVFRNGLLLDTSNYTETTTTVVMNNACAAGEIVVVINMRAVSSDIYYEIVNLSIASSTSNSITYVDQPYQIIESGDLLVFAATQPDPTATTTAFTVSSINTSTKTITFTGTISGATAGLNVYRKRNASAAYRPFSRFTYDVTNITTYQPANFTLNSGFELIYVNGVQINEIDYDLTGNVLSGFPSSVTGKLTIFQFAPNNLNVPASNITNTVAYSVAGVSFYTFQNNPLSMAVYANGALLTKGATYDYSAASTGYTLVTPFDNNVTLLNQQTFARMGAA